MSQLFLEKEKILISKAPYTKGKKKDFKLPLRVENIKLK